MRKSAMIIDGAIYDAITLLFEIYGLHPMTLRKWRKEGKLKSYVKIGNRFFYSRNEVKELLLHQGT